MNLCKAALGQRIQGARPNPSGLQPELLRASPWHTSDMDTVCQQGIRDNSSHWGHQECNRNREKVEKALTEQHTSPPQPSENTFEQCILPIRMCFRSNVFQSHSNFRHSKNPTVFTGWTSSFFFPLHHQQQYRFLIPLKAACFVEAGCRTRYAQCCKAQHHWQQ